MIKINNVTVENKRGINTLEKLKTWNMDDNNLKDYEGQALENIISNRASMALDYYFKQLEMAKKEIRGMFNKEEVKEILKTFNGHLNTTMDCKSLLMCATSKFEKLTEMQVHAVMVLCNEVWTENKGYEELFGLK